MKRIAVILAGCGVYDGSEIHETVCTLLAISRNNGTYKVFAPNINQYHVVNHLTGEVTTEERNVLIEAARLNRGEITPLDQINLEDFDSIVFPGGFGVAKNLCSYAYEGENFRVLEEVKKVVKNAYQMKMPIGAMCISPVLISKIISGSTVTIGADKATADDIEKAGAFHKRSQKGEVVIDEKNRIFSTPCYMLDSSIADIADGCDNLIKAIIAA